MSHLYSDGSLWMLQSQPSVWTSALPLLPRGSDTTVSGLIIRCWYKRQGKEAMNGKLQ